MIRKLCRTSPKPKNFKSQPFEQKVALFVGDDKGVIFLDFLKYDFTIYNGSLKKSLEKPLGGKD